MNVTRIGAATGVVAATLLLALLLAATGASAGGDLDLTFDGDGRVISVSGGDGSGQANAVVIQADGKIVAGGISGQGPNGNDATLIRYEPDGSLDPTFGTGGRVHTDVGGGTFERIFALAVQNDGKIVAAGGVSSGIPDGFALFRYEPNGNLDPTFGSGGIVLTGFGPGAEGAHAVAIQEADGKIVASGSYDGSFALARYDSAGNLDPSFGVGGKVVTDFGVNTSFGAVALVLQDDGRIVVAGTHDFASNAADFLVARYTANGALDPSFASGGFGTYDFGPWDEGAALAIQADGKIVVAGSKGPYPMDFALLRLNPDGTEDGTFGAGGKVVTDFGGGTYDAASGLAIQLDGKIVATGITSAGFVENFALARYRPTDGSLDPSFGTGGLVTTDMGSDYDEAQAIALQTDGRIVVAGRVVIDIPATVPLIADWGLARYDSGLPDHFECYEIDRLGPPFTPVSVTLADQFLTERATAQEPIALCNPVNKNDEGIHRPDGHLTCYSISPSGRPSPRTVLVTNQFGSAKLELAEATRLCLPAAKVPAGVSPGRPPEGVDHYKCYVVTDGDPFRKRTVTLRDQFGSLDAVVVRPVELCNPVDKNDEGIENVEAHEVCYEIDVPTFVPVNVATRDQFGVLQLQAVRPQKLCVPSAKEVLRD